MKFLLPLIFVAFWNTSFSQNSNTVIQNQNDSLTSENKTKVEKTPSGGVSKFYKYISDNFRIPNVVDFPGGKEIVEFTVKTDGTLGDIKILKDIGFGIGDQITKILKNSPKWTPGIKDGKAIDCKFTLPIQIPKSNDE